MKDILIKIYRTLYQTYGPRHWWPGETSFEVMVGAILTQNTSWRNVEKAIQKLKGKGVLNPEGIHHLKRSELARLIKSSGYYRIKTDRLKSFIDFLFEEYDGNIKKMGRERLGELREKLLGVKGRRILSRRGIISEKASYEEVQKLFMEYLPCDEKLFNEYHALFVYLGKTVCKKIPRCELCPLRDKIGNKKWEMESRKVTHL